MPRKRTDDHPARLSPPQHDDALQHARPEKSVEKQPFAGLPESVLALQQLTPQRHQNGFEHHRQRVRRENLPVDAIQLLIVERTDRLLNLLLPLLVIGLHMVIGDEVCQHLQRLCFRQDLADFAHGHAAIDPVDDAANTLDIVHGIQTMPAFGAGRLDQSVATLPGPQGHRIDAGEARHFADGEQLFAFERAGCC